MRARTIGQIASLIAGHIGDVRGPAAVAESAPVAVTGEEASAVDIDAISDEAIDRLLGGETASDARETVESIEH
jgi:hypothetical protein